MVRHREIMLASYVFRIKIENQTNTFSFVCLNKLRMGKQRLFCVRKKSQSLNAFLERLVLVKETCE